MKSFLGATVTAFPTCLRKASLTACLRTAPSRLEPSGPSAGVAEQYQGFDNLFEESAEQAPGAGFDDLFDSSEKVQKGLLVKTLGMGHSP